MRCMRNVPPIEVSHTLFEIQTIQANRVTPPRPKRRLFRDPPASEESFLAIPHMQPSSKFSTTADALAGQLQTKRGIDNALANLKKLGKEKWTKTMLRTRIVHLQEQWRKFDAVNARLRAAASSADQAQLPYFSEDQFEQTEETYLETLSFMTTPLDNLTSATIPVTENNFQIAWATLTTRYQNPRRLVTAHLQKLYDIPALSRESADDLLALRDSVCIIRASLQNLNRKPEDLWNDILVHLVSQKLDDTTRRAWKLKISDDVTPPSFDTLSNFIDSRVRGLEEFAESVSSNSSMHPVATTELIDDTSHVHAVTAIKRPSPPCPVCQAPHFFSACPKFAAKNPRDRRKLSGLYQQVFVSPVSPTTPFAPTRRRDTGGKLYADLVPTIAEPSTTVLLATALVKISVPSGRCVTIRALIDQGSETSFITEAMAHLLRAKRTRVTTTISAVGGIHAGTVRHAVQLQVAHRSSATPAISTIALVLPGLSTYAPKRIRDSQALAHLANLEWADPDPSSRAEIHLLLGADVYHSLILHGVRKGPHGLPVAQETVFGWVISGPIACQAPEAATSSAARSQPLDCSTITMHHCIHDDTLSHELKRFWELEEIPRRALLTPDEEQCESHFRAHTTRTADGRYVVRLPFRTGPPINIGKSRPLAEQIHRSLQRKFHRQPTLASEYQAFLHEYEKLGHMRRAPPSSPSSTQSVYLPHHPVCREGSATTHLRVVFNASSISSTGTSLNDHLLPGPKLQADLSSVLLRWRNFRYVYTADIAKMYRQILIDARDLDYQRIFWEEFPSDEPNPYQLLTVTYGMTCTPFLALRVLQQLSEDEEALNFP
ncbi:uncharacterized protein LOC143219728 [Lasioglossum baleicum]|uniref:uncharacterized protein LOC143219728 n=1 Tax=Lasioglossum baleicum TaxID=434251 RepID=UPI003FCE07A6